LTIEDLVEKWKGIPGVCLVRMVTPSRRQHFRTRAGEPGWLEGVEAALVHMAASTFCAGQNDRGWKADLDWFLRPDSVTKLIEGKFADGEPKHDQTQRSGRFRSGSRDPDAEAARYR
jgi:hypothetical protein